MLPICKFLQKSFPLELSNFRITTTTRGNVNAPPPMGILVQHESFLLNEKRIDVAILVWRDEA